MMPFDDELDEGPLSIGQLFMNRFQVVRLIGRGGYAFVYEARHRFMGHHVALKLLHRPGGVSKEMLARGQVEARIQQQVKHPNVVQIDDAGMTEDGQLYMVMELLGGRTLLSALQELGKLNVEEALYIAAQVARGMHAAHKLGAVHRDLKPANIIITADNVAKVIDFGVAKAIDLARFATQKNMMLGTPNYMSPEQVRGNPLTPSTDIYSLGITLYEGLAGFQPVDAALGDQLVDMLDLARAIAFGPLTPLDEIDPLIPRYVADFIATACSKKPEERFASMKAMAVAAEECLARYRAEAKRAGRVLPMRDLSRQGKVRSGVEVRESGRAPAANSAGADTEPTAAPFSAPASSYEGSAQGRPATAAALPEPAVRTAPLPRPAAGSERPTLWVQPGSHPDSLRPTRTTPAGSPPSRSPSAKSARPAQAAPLAIASPQEQPAVAQPRRSARQGAEVAARDPQVVAQRRSPVPSAVPEAMPSGHRLRTILIGAGAAGFVVFGAMALVLTQPPSRTADAKLDATPPPALQPDATMPAPLAQAAPAASLENPAALAVATSATSATSATPVTSALPIQQSGAAPPPAPRVKQIQARPAPSSLAPSKPDIDTMAERLRRAEERLDKPKTFQVSP